MVMERIGEGRTAEVFTWDDDRVLKLFRPEFGDSSAREEAEIAQLVSTIGAPAPLCYGTVEVEGRTGVVFDRLSGPLLGDRLATSDPIVLIEQLAGLQARIHANEGPTLPSFTARVRHIAADLDPRISEAVERRLDDLGEASTLLHADLHPYNVMSSGTEWLAIDWDAACHGPRHAGVARSQFLLMEARPPVEEMVEPVAAIRALLGSSFLDAYNEAFPIDLDEVAAWRLPILAARIWEEIPGEREFLLSEIDNEMRRSPSVAMSAL